MDTPGGRYTVSIAQSYMEFEGRSTLHGVRGRANGLDGKAFFEWNDDGSVAGEPVPKLCVEFPFEQVRSGNELQDREMRKLVDSRRFPKISAALQSLEPAPDTGSYAATGEITFAGRKRVYDGELQIVQRGDVVTIDGKLTLDIRDFGVEPPRMFMMKVDPVVRVTVHLVASKAA
jgi:polyisoprenoid-binding protein YceI